MQLFFRTIFLTVSSILKTFTKQFRASNPLPIQYNSSRFKRINLLRECSKHGLILNWKNKNAIKEKLLLIILHAEDTPKQKATTLMPIVYHFHKPVFRPKLAIGILSS